MQNNNHFSEPAIVTILFSLVTMMMPSLTYGHVVSQSHNLYNGFVHPFTGFDHFITMFSIGMLSFYAAGNKKDIFRLPMIFCLFLFMALVFQTGNLLTVHKLFPAGIIILIGLLIFQIKIKNIVWLLLPIVAFAHGHIHTTDAMFIYSNIPYILGFVAATFILHVAGIYLAKILYSLHKSTHKLVGSCLVLLGFYLLT